MMENKKGLQERAHDLVSTSVDDLNSSMYFFTGTDLEHVQIILRGLVICKRRGEKTKVKLLERKIKKMKQEQKDGGAK